MKIELILIFIKAVELEVLLNHYSTYYSNRYMNWSPLRSTTTPFLAFISNHRVISNDKDVLIPENMPFKISCGVCFQPWLYQERVSVNITGSHKYANVIHTFGYNNKFYKSGLNVCLLVTMFIDYILNDKRGIIKCTLLRGDKTFENTIPYRVYTPNTYIYNDTACLSNNLNVRIIMLRIKDKYYPINNIDSIPNFTNKDEMIICISYSFSNPEYVYRYNISQNPVVDNRPSINVNKRSQADSFQISKIFTIVMILIYIYNIYSRGVYIYVS